MGRENGLNEDHTNSHRFNMSLICLVKTHISFNVSGTCRGQKELFCMYGMDRASGSVKSRHVLKNIIFEKKTNIIFENRNIFVNLWGFAIAGSKT
jgi:hypothetical protein